MILESFGVSQLVTIPQMSWNVNIEYSGGKNYRFDRSIEIYPEIKNLLSLGIMNWNPSHFGWLQVDYYRGTESKYLPFNILIFVGRKNTGDIYSPFGVSSFLFLGPNYAFTRGVGYYLFKTFTLFNKQKSILEFFIHTSLAPFVKNEDDYTYGIVLFPRLVYSYGQFNLNANIISGVFHEISDGRKFYRIYPMIRLGYTF